MATYRTILTTKGIQLAVAAAATGIPIVITDMAVGDGNGNPVTPNPEQTSLARERYRHAVNQLTVVSNDLSRFVAELIIPAEIGGFTIREVGLYTNQGDLFAVANVPNAYKPTDSEGSFGDTVVKMIFKVDNASVVTLVADPNVAVATQSWVLNNVTAARLIPGGLSNQILAKKSNADGDVEWRDASDGVTVIVFSREETQTLSAGQVNIDLATITTEGAAVYIEGVRLRRSEFTIPSDTRITLVASYPAGSRATVVQNEEVGATDLLRRPNNLSDVMDKAAARDNLGLPNWLASSRINWLQLDSVPAYGTRWPTFNEVTNKPSQYPPSSHTHPWGQISEQPDTATRWPTWNEVISKPSVFPPAAHIHPEYIPFNGGGEINNGSLSVYVTPVPSSDISRAFTVMEAGSEGDPRRFDIALYPGSGPASREVFFRALAVTKFTFDVATSRFNGILSAPTAAIDGDINIGARAKVSGAILSNGSITSNSGGILSNGSTSSFSLVERTDFEVKWSTYASAGNYRVWNNVNQDVLTVSRAGAVTVKGAVTAAGGFDFGSSLKLKDRIGDVPYTLDDLARIDVFIGKYNSEYNDDDRQRIFQSAESLADAAPETVDKEGVEFQGERVASLKIDQVQALQTHFLKLLDEERRKHDAKIEALWAALRERG